MKISLVVFTAFLSFVLGNVELSVSAGGIVCAKVGSAPLCWGNGGFGSLGRNDQVNYGKDPAHPMFELEPFDYNGAAYNATQIKSLQAYGDFSCVLSTTGVVICFGDNTYNQLGHTAGTPCIGCNAGDTTLLQPFSFPFTEEVASIHGGFSSHCVITANGKVFCYGANDFGLLGVDSSSTSFSTPSAVSFLQFSETFEVTQVSLGFLNTCGLFTNGRMLCWGSGLYGVLGTGSLDHVGAGTASTLSTLGYIKFVDDTVRITEVSVGGFHACALFENGRAVCWGAHTNSYGQIGAADWATVKFAGVKPGPDVSQLPYIEFKETILLSQITGGRAYTCGLFVTGKVVCWGFNRFGTLGIDSKDTIDIGGEYGPPLSTVGYIDFGSAERVASVHASAYDRYVCAMFESGGIKCWGNNDFGQLGRSGLASVGENPGDMSSIPWIEFGVLMLSQVKPASGGVEGGQSITIIGSAFDKTYANLTVRFAATNSSQCASVTDIVPAAIASRTHFVVTLPPWPEATCGIVPVSVSLSPDGVDFPFAAPFYLFGSGVKPTSASPASGPTRGGTKLTVLGSGFTYTPDAQCLFATDELTNSTTVALYNEAAGSLTCSSAPQSAGGGPATVSIGLDGVNFYNDSSVVLNYYDVTAMDLDYDGGLSVGNETIHLLLTGSGLSAAGFGDQPLVKFTAEEFGFTKVNSKVEKMVFEEIVQGTFAAVPAANSNSPASAAITFSTPNMEAQWYSQADEDFPQVGVRAKVSVSLNGRDWEPLSATYDYFLPPEVTGLSSEALPLGTAANVTVQGNGFLNRTRTRADNVVVVLGGNTLLVGAAASSQRISALFPAINTPGVYSVEISLNAGLDISDGKFTVTIFSIVSVSPAGVPAGLQTSVVVTGTFFAQTPRMFCMYAPGQIERATFISSTEVSCRTPVSAKNTASAVKISFSGDGIYYASLNLPSFATYVISVTAISPSSGPLYRGGAAGAPVITLAGTGFPGFPGAQCRFGTNVPSPAAAAPLTSTSMGCPLPAYTDSIFPGLLRVFVAFNGVDFEDTKLSYSAFSVTSVDPSLAPSRGGSRVVVRGTGYRTVGGGVTVCRFVSPVAASGAGSPTSPAVVISGQSLSCTIPAGLPAGQVRIDVSSDGGTRYSDTTNATLLIYETPRVSSISPRSGRLAGGTSVSVFGTGFVAQLANRVLCRIGQSLGSLTVVNATVRDSNTLVCDPIPAAQSSGRIELEVSLDGLEFSSDKVQFTYVTVSGFSPSVGSVRGNTSVTLTGGEFLADLNVTCEFGAGRTVPGRVLSRTEAECRTPAAAAAGAAGAGQVSVGVSTNGGVDFAYAPATSLFRYVEDPEITAVAPVSGPGQGGTAVTVSGTRFPSGADVARSVKCWFGETEATSAKLSNSTNGEAVVVICTSPAGSTSAVVSVSFNGARAEAISNSSVAFAWFQASGFEPRAAAVSGGTQVTVTGVGFTSRVNGTYTCVFVISGSRRVVVAATRLTDTSILCDPLPSLRPSLRGMLALGAGLDDAALGVGSRGSSSFMTVSVGDGFAASAPPSRGAASFAAAQTSADENVTLAVSVSTDGGQTAAALPASDPIVVFVEPTLASFSPTEVTGSGGTITVTGANFRANLTTCRIGAVPSSASVLSPTLAVCDVPRGAPGNVTVAVTNNGQQFAVAASGTLRYTQCVPGTYSPTFAEACRPCPAGFFSETFGATACTPCRGDSYTKGDNRTACTPCPENTRIDDLPADDVSKCECKVDFYFPEERGVRGDQACLECPDGATCAGGDAIPLNIAGYWRSDKDPNIFVQCEKVEFCPAEIGKCAKNTGGRACADCVDDYAPYFGQCRKCPPGSIFIPIMFFVLSVVLIIVLVSAAGRGSSGYFGAIGIFVKFLQVLAIIANLNVGWGESTRAALQWLSFMFLFKVGILMPSCYSSSLGDNTDLVLTLCLPIYTAALCFVIYLLWMPLMKLLQRVLPGSQDTDVKSRFIYAFLQLLSFEYMMLVSVAVQHLSCKRQEDGEYVLSATPWRKCLSNEWWRFLPLSIVGLVVYGFCIPAGIYMFVKRNTHRISDAHFAKRYGPLFSSYVPTKPHWEAFVMTERALIAIVGNVMSFYVGLQIALLTLIIFVALVIFQLSQPFLKPNDNFLHRWLKHTSLLILLCGNVVYIGQLSDERLVALDIFIVVVIAIATAVFVMQVLNYLRGNFVNRRTKMLEPLIVSMSVMFSTHGRILVTEWLFAHPYSQLWQARLSALLDKILDPRWKEEREREGAPVISPDPPSDAVINAFTGGCLNKVYLPIVRHWCLHGASADDIVSLFVPVMTEISRSLSHLPKPSVLSQGMLSNLMIRRQNSLRYAMMRSESLKGTESGREREITPRAISLLRKLYGSFLPNNDKDQIEIARHPSGFHEVFLAYRAPLAMPPTQKGGDNGTTTRPLSLSAPARPQSADTTYINNINKNYNKNNMDENDSQKIENQTQKNENHIQKKENENEKEKSVVSVEEEKGKEKAPEMDEDNAFVSMVVGERQGNHDDSSVESDVIAL